MADFQVSLEKLLEYCEFAAKQTFQRYRYFFEAPENDWIHGVPRLLLLLSGTASCRFGFEGGEGRESFELPTVFYCSRMGWFSSSIAGEKQPNRWLSFSYFPTYIRAMHIDFDGEHVPPTGRDVFYHTREPLSTAGFALLGTMDAMHAAAHDELIPSLCNTLFELTIAELRASAAAPVLGVRRLWDQINTFLRDHREEPLSRASVAKLFAVSPGYVSELCRHYMDEPFTALLLRYRLEHAENLLLHTRLSVDEIASRSGFAGANYFIRRFKQQYGVTPHVFRNKLPGKVL